MDVKRIEWHRDKGFVRAVDHNGNHRDFPLKAVTNSRDLCLQMIDSFRGDPEATADELLDKLITVIFSSDETRAKIAQNEDA